MYAKLVIYDENKWLSNGVSSANGEAGAEVVPYEVQLFEGRRIKYTKLSVSTAEEFNKISSELGCYALLTGLPIDENGPTKKFEFIVLAIHKDIDLENSPVYYIIGAYSTLFIMNESGKTIDKMVCRNN